jgi:DNA-binding response OmpR family regulator
MMQSCESKPARASGRILLAEDNPSEAFLLQEAFAEQRIPVDIQRISDGERLLAKLRACPLDVDLILLELNLPRRTAEEVLQTLRTENVRLDLPVTVLSSPISNEQSANLRELGVQSILVKPVDLDGYFELARDLSRSW